MYFKQIEMHGFKSFADRTQVNLDPGITAIVGPNGCGKSNILDALRWCLGEQSAKALRGSHMQDVIFNGSEHRPPMGMAEVSLVFDNADGKLALDFAEVQIGRRVYRSGESEYLINKTPCRLRDIQELFMDTGIGTNAYSLIGQGKIDLVLSSKPEDRRYLFEEAAGIIKYKSRKRVAMRRLDGAEQNLLRLNDIIAEVERQMRSLKRQVNAALRHREYTESLRELEIRNAWLQHNELSGQIEDLKERFGTAQDAHEKASSAVNGLEARLEEMNLNRIETERALMARRDGEHQIDAEMEKIERQIALLRKEIDFAQSRREESLREHEAFKERAASLKTTQGEISERTGALQAEVRAIEEAIAAKQEAYAQGEAAVTAADGQVEASRGEALDTINTRNRAQTELETVAVGLSGVDSQLESIFSQQKDENSRHEALSAQLQEERGKESEAQQALTETVDARRTAQQRHGELATRMEALNKTWQNLREKKSSQLARLTSLRELRDSYEGFAAGVRAIMLAKKENVPACQGIIGPVGDLISTKKEYSTALEAALGGNINNIVVEEADGAKSAIAFLKENRAGRVTFLPLDTIRGSSRDDSGALRGLPGVVGNAIGYVECEERILPAVRYLLYNTVIVETIDDAIRIARSERRYPRLVTLEGEVVTSSGAVTGGRTKHESRGMLGRSAEIEELEQAVDEAEGRIREVASEGATVTGELQSLAKQLKTFEGTESERRAVLNALGVEIAKFATELENLSQTGGRLAQQRDALTAQRAALETQRAAAQERIDSMSDSDELQRQQMADAQAAAAEARRTLSAIGGELADLRVQLASVTQNIEENERNRTREEREKEEALRNAAQRIEAAEAMTVREKDFEAGIAGEVERAKALSETKDEAHGKVLEARQEQAVLLEAMDKDAAALKKIRVEAGEAQKEVHKLELELTHKEDKVEYFLDRIRTEYGLALASLEEDEVGTDEYDEKEREELINDLRKKLQRLGTVNLMAIEEYEALEKRDTFLREQEEDLRKARETLLGVIERIDGTIRELFMTTFRMIEENFKNYFRRLFNGGQARIFLVDENDPLESGIEIEARPPGKKPQTISLLSGGEQAMTAIALLFSIFTTKPSPFCVLDEVDAPLDDANIGRFLNLLDEFTDKSQFIIITHNKQTMAHADALFGVTQQELGVSQMVSVRFEEIKEADDAA